MISTTTTKDCWMITVMIFEAALADKEHQEAPDILIFVHPIRIPTLVQPTLSQVEFSFKVSFDRIVEKNSFGRRSSL